MSMQRFSRLTTELFARSRVIRSILTTVMTIAVLGAGNNVSAQTRALGVCDTVSAVEVEATAGTLGPTGYATLKLAFDAINAGTHQGAVSIEVCLSTTEGTTPATLNSSGAGAAVYTSVGIRPLADGLTITGNPATGFGVIQLKGADNVTIDGDNPNTAGTNRNLTINNTNTTTAIAGSVIRIATAATVVTSADNNTIRNLVLNGNVTGGNISTITSASGSSNSSFVIYAGGNGGTTATDAPTAITSVTTNSAPNGTTINNLVISNNAVNQAARAIVFNGAAASVATVLTISDNVIGAAGSLVGAPPFIAPASTIYTKGIWINGANGIAVSGNSVRNVLSYVATTMTGVELVGAIGTSVTISNNTINGLVQNGGANATKGIQISSATGTYAVAGNTINNVQSLGNASGTAGMDLGGTVTSALVERNRISTVYNRNAGTFGAWGMSIGAGTAVTVRNNFISDVNGVMTGGAAFSTSFGIHGLRIAGGTGHQIQNNTINLTGALLANGTTVLTSACTIVGTGQSGIDMRNNICANTLTGSVASTSHVSLFLPTGATSAMNLTLNNNDYFSGPDAATQGIAQVGTTFGTTNFLASNFNAAATAPATNLRSYTDTLRASTGNDSATIVTDPVLVSASDLHITVGSPAQNTGATIGSVANDIDEQLRPGGAGYDIGADEVDGVTPPANDMRATAFIDPIDGGVKLVNAAFSPQASFTNLGTVTQAGVTVRYRIVNAGLVEVYNQTANIPSLAFNASTTVTFPAATLPVAGTYSIFATSELVGDTVPANNTINGSLTVAAPLAGTYTVGSGGAYPSLTNSGGIFQALNSLGASANITIEIIADLSGETGANALNEIAGGFTTLIKPTGAARAITSTGTAVAVIKINDGDNVTIDGSLSAGSDRSLTITNTNTAASTAAIWVASAINGASNNTIKNVNLAAGADQTLATVFNFGIISSSSAAILTGGTDNDSNTYRNNFVKKAAVGIISIGGTAANPNQSTTISNNLIGPTAFGIDQVSLAGVLIFNENLTSIVGNEIRFIGDAATTGGSSGRDHVGIVLGSTGAAWSTTGAGTAVAVTNANVSGNLIHDILELGTFSAAGITVNGTNSGNPTLNTIANNIIYNVLANGTSGDQAVGIGISSGNGDKVVFNSVNLSGDIDPGASTAASTPSFGISVATATPTNLTLKDNISVMDLSSNTGTLFHAAINVVATSYPWGTGGSDFNDWFAPAGNAQARVGSTAAGGVFYTSLATWQAAVTQDAASLSVDPLFVSNANLHLQAASPVQNVGTPIAGVTVDFDGDLRSATTPEIGADELNTPPSITPTAGGIARTQGTAASNSQIAVVSDLETAVGSLVVTTQTVPAGITVSGIVNTAGAITANVAASCSAAVGANLVGLRVTDAGALFADANLTVNVATNTAPTLGVYPSGSALTGGGTTVTPGTAPGDNGSIASITASAPGFTGSFLVDTGTGVVTVSNAGPANVYTVTVIATDNCGAQTTATFQLTVTNPNTAPSITPTAGGIARTQDTPASNSQIAAVSDIETGNGLLVVTTQGALPTGITVAGIANSAGAITANVAASCLAATGANLVGLRVTDAGGLFTDANLTVNVAANTAPVLGTYPASTATTGTNTTVTPSVAPSDNGSIASITASAPGFGGSFMVNTATGVVTVTNAGPAAIYTVTVLATDACGLQTSATFQLTVSNANTAPVNTPGAALTRQRGSAASSGALTTVSDGESPAQDIVVTAQTVPAGLTVTGIVNTAGAITGNVAASCAATLGNNTVVLRATDPGALFTDGNLTVNVTANTAVVQGTYPATSVIAGAGTTVTPDAAPTDNGTITSMTAAAPGFTGTFLVNTSTGVVTVTNAGPGGVFTVTVTATDNCNTTSTRTFTLTVNAQPTIAAAAVTLKAGDVAAVRTIANVADNEDPENTLAVTINGGASSTSNGVTVGSIAVDAAGIVTANVVASCSATNASFTLRVTDSASLFREATLNTVVTANTAPLLSYGSTTVLAGSGVVIGPSAGPTDSGTITSIVVQSLGTYTGGATVAPSGNVTLTNAGPDGSHTLTIRATDNCGANTDAPLSLNVLADVMFSNGFEDVIRTPAKMKLPIGDEGVVQTLLLPAIELQGLAAAQDTIDAIEFEIGTARALLQVRGATGYREMRLIEVDGQGQMRAGAWMEISELGVLQLQWNTRTVGGALQVQTALKAVSD